MAPCCRCQPGRRPHSDWRRLVLALLDGTPQVITGSHAHRVYGAATGAQTALTSGNLLANPWCPGHGRCLPEASRGNT